MSNLSFTSKKQNLPVFYLCIRYIEVRMYLAICYPTYFRVAIPFQPSPCLNSYSFLLLAHQCSQSGRVPKSPAKMQKSQLWTFITFFWLGIFSPYFGKLLIYKYVNIIYRKFAPILKVESRFFMIRA
jgi:hypothetical protein